jgi:hypothetical protein
MQKAISFFSTPRKAISFFSPTLNSEEDETKVRRNAVLPAVSGVSITQAFSAKPG